MAELINIVLRFALYVDVLLLFGLALFALYSADSALRFRPMLRGMALIAALLSVAGLLLMTSTMSGETAIAALWPHLQIMLRETDVGLAWAIRIAALTVLLIRPEAWLASISGGVALASLAWSGHGAMDEGALRFWHFFSDILHLLAAGAWLGAMLALLLMAQGRGDAPRLRLLIAAVKRFEWVGAAIVLTLTITGEMNRPPYEKNAAVSALFDQAREIAAGMGLDLKECAMTGGGSDGNFTAAIGTPTLDGLGCDGDGAHTLQEFCYVSSLAPRAALMARLLETL